MQNQKSSPISVCCIAAPSDAVLLTQWEEHLLPLEQAGQITIWSEQHLMAGADRAQQFHEHLDQARVTVFLLSVNFFASDECVALMHRALTGRTRVIPLLVSPVDWKASRLANFACLPFNGQFVTTWDNRADAFHVCVHNLRRLLGLPVLPPQGGESALQNQNRVRMLRRLRRSYEELMNQSLQGATRLELSLVDKPGAVQNATNLLLRASNRAGQTLPPGTSIAKVYDEADHELLILGEPGTGKSTLLLDLAQQLVVRAEQDETHLLPVILPLSSWAVKRPPLQDWIAEQLAEIYDVPRRLSVQWVQEGSILPLLDGLDEMDETVHPACIAAINVYHTDYMASLVVCSRTTEYEVAAERHRLVFQRAIVVQSLTHEIVDTYLALAGKPLAALRSALKENVILRDLTTTPLMLNILILTYQGTSVRTLARQESLLLQQVWDDYVRRMVERKGDSKRSPLELTRSRLGWLARQMRDHNQTVFYLERLQPDWLSVEQRHTYARRAVRLPAIIIGILIGILVQSYFFGNVDFPSLLQYGILGGVLGWLCYESISVEQQQHVWRKRLTTSACIGLIYGLSFGFMLGSGYTLSQWQIDVLSSSIGIGLSSLFLQYLLKSPFRSTLPYRSLYLLGLLRKWPPFEWVIRRGAGTFQKVNKSLLVALTIGLSQGLTYGLSQGVLAYGLGFRVSLGLSYGLTNGLSYGLIGLALGTPMGEVHLAERLRWTWRNVRRSLFRFRHLRITILLTCISMIFVGLNDSLGFSLGYSVSDGLTTGMTIGLSYWFLIGVFQGTDQAPIEDQDRLVTNQGIRRSLRNSVRMGLIGGTMVGCVSILSIGLSDELIYGLLYGPSTGLSSTLSDVLSVGLSLGILVSIGSALLICLLTGGLAAWRHYHIRFQLWRSRTFPWQAPQFLKDSTDRIMLRRIRGGYGFVHRLFQAYILSFDTSSLEKCNCGYHDDRFEGRFCPRCGKLKEQMLIATGQNEVFSG